VAQAQPIHSSGSAVERHSGKSVKRKNSRLTDPPNFSFALDSSSDVDPPYHVSVGLHAEILLHRQAGNRQVGTAVDTVLSCSFGPGILHASQEL